MKTYLPEIDVSDLVAALQSGCWFNIESLLEGQEYERLGLERALTIASDLYTRHQSLKGLRVLDVGCNNALFSKVLAAQGCAVVGIDNGDIDNQGLYGELRINEGSSELEFHRTDLMEYLQSDVRYWDYILLLSVAHHWETGYAMSGQRAYSDSDIRNIFSILFDRTNHSIYYECPVHEPGFEQGYGLHFLMKYCDHLPEMRVLGNTIGPNGYLRELWALDLE